MGSDAFPHTVLLHENIGKPIASVEVAKADVEAASEEARKEAGADARAITSAETKATERPKAEAVISGRVRWRRC